MRPMSWVALLCLIALGAAPAKESPPPKREASKIQPLDDRFDYTPPGAPFVPDDAAAPPDGAKAFLWKIGNGAGDVASVSLVVHPPTAHANHDHARAIKDTIERRQAELKTDPETMASPKVSIGDGFADLHYRRATPDGSKDVSEIFRDVNGAAVVRVDAVTALNKPDSDRAKAVTGAVRKLGEEVALSVARKGTIDPDAKAPVETLMKPAAPAASKPGVVIAPPAPPPPSPQQLLAAAQADEAAHPAEAYAALKALARKAPSSPEARTARQELAKMEADDAVARKVMAGETKAYAAFNLAKNFESLGQSDKARQRYETVMKEYPDTMCAAMALRRIEELMTKATKP